MNDFAAAEKARALDVVFEGSFGFSLNVNDMFSWATADAEEMSIDDFFLMVPVIAKYGRDALTAYVAVKRGAQPIGDSLTENYHHARILVELVKSRERFFMKL